MALATARVRSAPRGGKPLADIARLVERSGASLTLVAPDGTEVAVGPRPHAARVIVHDARVLDTLRRLDVLALAEAYIAGRADVTGDLGEVLRVGDLATGTSQWLGWLRLWLRLHLPGRHRRREAATAFHYDRPPEFFLPWLDPRWRSYSHGFYESLGDDWVVAQERKLRFVVDALALRPGMEVLDVGAGWGSFLEYAGRRGIRVRAITPSREQVRYVSELIRRERLPCTVEHADFLGYRPPHPVAAVAFVGCLEHMPDYRRVVRHLERCCTADARVYADFCAQATPAAFGTFLARHVWPGPTACVAIGDLVAALAHRRFNLHLVADDTRSYGCTVRDWADALERERGLLAAQFGAPAVRTFLLFLRASQHFFFTNRTQAYHLVAGRQAASL